MLNLKKLSTPSLVVSVTEVKEFLRIDNSLEDSRLENLIKAATARLEKAADTVFIETDYLITLDRFPIKEKNEWWDGVRDGSITELQSPARHINLPIAPIRSVTFFKTVDDAGGEYVIPTNDYKVDNVGRGRISLKLGAVWPATVLAANNGILIQVKAGIAANASEVPDEIKTAVLEFVAAIYEHRGDEFPEIPATAYLLIEPYRRFKV